MIFLAVVNNQPKEMGLVQAIQHFSIIASTWCAAARRTC
jgi:hypothetical protein